MLDRRSFLAALGAAFLPGGAARSDEADPVYVSACQDAAGDASVAAFRADGHLLFASRLPTRGHDVAPRPGSAEIVVFARRPGNWAAIVDRRDGRVLRLVTSPPERHFFGHGTFSADGSLLYATENAVRAAGSLGAGDGVLGLYDARDGYRRLGEIPTRGLGPHDLALLPAAVGGGVLVANGGTRTLPESGREILNPTDLAPSLALLDPASGEARRIVDLGSALRGLSIRHLAVAPSGDVVFGCQHLGDADAMPPLLGILPADGAPRMIELPEDDLEALANYVGSVRLDASGTILAATSPIGQASVFYDLAAGRPLGRRRMSDVCGVAPGFGAATFVLSSGNDGVRLASPARSELARLGGSDLGRWIWDNHLVRL